MNIFKITQWSVGGAVLIVVALAMQPSLQNVEDARNTFGVLIQSVQDAQATFRADTLRNLPRYRAIIYQANGDGRSVYIFSDPTCPHCVDLHAEIPRLVEKGYSVHLILSPRSSDEPISNQIWCAPDRKASLDRVMMGEYAEKNAGACDLTGLQENRSLADSLGAEGKRPFLVFDNGEYIQGAITASEMEKIMVQHAQPHEQKPKPQNIDTPE